MAKLEEEKAKKAKEEEESKKKEEEEKAKGDEEKSKKESEASKALIEIEENKQEVPEEEEKKAGADAADWVDEDSRSAHSNHTGDDLPKSRPGSAHSRGDESDSSSASIDFDNLP